MSGAKIDFRKAAEVLRQHIPAGKVTELDLDDYRGKVVWEGDVHDGSGTKHEVKLDAASGSLLSSTTDQSNH